MKEEIQVAGYYNVRSVRAIDCGEAIGDKIVIRLHSAVIQKYVREFTLSQRSWLSYSADKLEHILRYYKAIGDSSHYSDFDSNTEEAIFIEITNKILPGRIEALEEPRLSLWERFRNWITNGKMCRINDNEEMRKLAR